MTRAITAYVATLVVFLAIDMVWLNAVASEFYNAQLGDRLEINTGAAVGFYALYVVGIVMFGVWPALRSGRLRDAALWGGLFGFFCYATYDLTNLATLKDWPWMVAVVDIPWGVFLTGASALGGAWATRALLGSAAVVR